MAILLIDHPGQLGNQLATFAHLIGHALESKQVVWNPAFRRYAGFFPLFEKNLFCRYPYDRPYSAMLPLEKRLGLLLKKIARSRYARSRASINYTSLEINEEKRLVDCYQKSSKNLLLDGWMFRDYEALEKHRATIKAVFTPKAQITAAVDDWIKSFRSGQRPLVGLHIRRGDFKEHCPDLYFSDDFYLSLAKRIVDILQTPPIFVVCSNETVPKSLIESLEVIVGLGGIIEDLYTLSKCDFMAGPLSTFSSWASFYGDKPAYLAK